MPVDSFKHLPRLVTRYYKLISLEDRGRIPWTSLQKTLGKCRFALVTSGGLYDKRTDSPFDLEREQREPAWGDPSYRAIPKDIPVGELGASHHHLNTAGVLVDRNILLPIDRFNTMVDEGRIGSLANHHYSFMGYQGFPADLSGWLERSGPEVAGRMSKEEVDCVFLTTA
jgi:D-proline reductase (dithiol) PrdB